jgi:lipoprotein-anchoring transpeptidase ErfK/SrfK
MPMGRTQRRVIMVAATAALAAGAASASASTRTPPARPLGQQLAVIMHDTGVFAGPGTGSAHIGELKDGRPITGERTILPVIGQARGPHGMRWLNVLLPGRPDSHNGWIRLRATTPTFTRWRILVSLSLRRVTVLHAGRVARTFSAVVGKPSTPTPTGTFFVEENVKLDAAASGAPDALALSARSNILATFDGGPGQIAFHGIENIGGVPGTAVSHGCVRLDTPDIIWLAAHIGPGVPVTITQ